MYLNGFIHAFVLLSCCIDERFLCAIGQAIASSNENGTASNQVTASPEEPDDAHKGVHLLDIVMARDDHARTMGHGSAALLNEDGSLPDVGLAKRSATAESRDAAAVSSTDASVEVVHVATVSSADTSGPSSAHTTDAAAAAAPGTSTAAVLPHVTA